MKKFNPLVKSSIIYSISNIYLRIINLLVLIFTTKYISPSELGLFKTLQIVPSFSKYLCFDFFSLTLRESAKINITNNGCNSSIRNSTYTYYALWNIFIVIAVTFLFLTFFNIYKLYFPFLISTLIFIIIFNLFKNDLKLLQRFGTLSIIETLSYTGSFVIFIFTVKEYKLYSRLSFDLIIPTLSIIVFIILFKFRFKLNFKRDEISRQMKISFPLYMSTLLHGFFLWFERLYIGSFYGLEQLGFFMFVIIIIDLLSIIVSSFIQVYNMHIYKKLNSFSSFKNCIIDISDLFFTVSFVSVLLGFSFFIFGPYLIETFFLQYKLSLEFIFYVPIILWFSSILNVISSILISEYFNKQNTIVYIKIFSLLCYLLFLLVIFGKNSSLNELYLSRLVYTLVLFMLSFITFISFCVSKKIILFGIKSFINLTVMASKLLDDLKLFNMLIESLNLLSEDLK